MELAREPGWCVGDVALAPIPQLAVDVSLRDAAAAMSEAGVTAVLIVEGTAGYHILTEHDVTRAVGAVRDPGSPAVHEATVHPIAVGVDVQLIDALALMVRWRVRDLPAVGRQGDVVGLLTMAGALEAILRGTTFPVWLAALRVALRVELAGAAT